MIWTLTDDFDLRTSLYRAKVKHYTKYVDIRSFLSKVIVRMSGLTQWISCSMCTNEEDGHERHTHQHTHTWVTTLSVNPTCNFLIFLHNTNTLTHSLTWPAGWRHTYGIVSERWFERDASTDKHQCLYELREHCCHVHAVRLNLQSATLATNLLHQSATVNILLSSSSQGNEWFCYLTNTSILTS